MPGWPIGFGDHKQQSLALNPAGIDPNLFYGELMYEDCRYAEAVQYLEKALAAPPRPDRPVADAGRRSEITALLSRLRSKLKS